MALTPAIMARRQPRGRECFGVAARLKKPAPKIGRWQFGKNTSEVNLSAHQWTPQKQLKLQQRGRVEKSLKMPHRLQKRIGVLGRRSRLPLRQPRPHEGQTQPQPPHQSVKRLQRKRQPQRLRGGFDRCARQQPAKQLPEQRRPHRMARQNISQKNRKSPATTAPQSAIGAKNALTAHNLASGSAGIITVKKTVPIQGLAATAEGTTLVLKRKSCWFNSCRSRTKR